MILNMVGGGSSEQAFAFIVATYPSGSTCTCTNSFDYKDISATQRLFYISEGTVPFDCVVTATDGTDIERETVSIAEEGQSTSVTLSLPIYLFRDGSYQGTWESKAWWYENSEFPKITGQVLSSNKLTLSRNFNSQGAVCTFVNNQEIPTGKSVLTCKVESLTKSSASYDQATIDVCVIDRYSNNYTIVATGGSINAPYSNKTYTLSINSIPSGCRFAVLFYSYNSDITDIITEVKIS